MARGIFTSTFYLPEAPQVCTEDLDLNLSNMEQTIVDDILATETIEQMMLEFGAVGHSLVWQVDHFEIIPNRGAAQCAALQQHCRYFYK